MIDIATLIILAALAAVPLIWLLPRAVALDGVALWTAVVFALLAPQSAAWLIGSACLTPLVLWLAERWGHRGAIAALWSAVLLGAFAAAQLTPGIIWLGGAFFTLRHLHVLGDWWMGRLERPRLRAHLRYQLFLPVMFIGPINRIQNFERQCARRRWSTPDFLHGLERVVLGAFSAEVIGGVLLPLLGKIPKWLMGPDVQFLKDWVMAALDWVTLYFVFSGLTSVALGICLMMGLKLEENFNRPWRAHNLIEFWGRWHITLTNWCHDYVYRPVMALTRSPLLGLVLGMLAIGLWHQFSWYYVLWAFWQALGVVLTHAIGRMVLAMPPGEVPRLPRWLSTLLMLAWLSLADPVVTRLLELG